MGHAPLGERRDVCANWHMNSEPVRHKPGDTIGLIGAAVLRLRLYRGWRQVDLERASGVDQTTISRLERGRQRGLSVRKLAAILDVLRVGEVSFKPMTLAGAAHDVERRLLEDRWLRVGRYAEQRLRRRSRTRSTISTRPSSETRHQFDTQFRTQ